MIEARFWFVFTLVISAMVLGYFIPVYSFLQFMIGAAVAGCVAGGIIQERVKKCDK